MGNDGNKKGPKLLDKWLKGRGKSGGKRKPSAFGKKLRNGFESLKQSDPASYVGPAKWALILIGLFLLADLTSGFIGMFLESTPPKFAATSRRKAVPRANPGSFRAIEKRNMFNVDNTIPEPFETGLLDCMSQAKRSNRPVTLMGTVVMNDDRFSVALIQDKGTQQKLAVRKDETFLGKFQVLKIDRKRLCFQVNATQEMEYIEIPDEGGGLRVSPSLTSGRPPTQGITPKSDTEYEVNRSFIDNKLLDLNSILQTAKAVPYIEPGSGKFKGFLIQSINPDSPFADLGMRQGDVLTGVNGITLDNAGKGLEAFQKLRNASKIDLDVIRGGSKTTMTYQVK